MFVGSRIGSNENHAVRGVHTDRRPDFLTVDHEAVGRDVGSALEPGEIASCIGLAEALTPKLCAVNDRVEMRSLCFGTHRGDGRTDVARAVHRWSAWRASARVFRVALQLFADGEPTAANFNGPRRCAPTGRAQGLLKVDEGSPFVARIPTCAVFDHDRCQDGA